MQVTFRRWCVTKEHRTMVAVNPKRVDCVEAFGPAFIRADTGKTVPPAVRIVMQGKQEFIVVGTVEQVAAALNYEGE
jgi:hypothetical protein